MGFSGLLGNESIKQRLSGAAADGKLSHSYIIAGPRGSGKHTLARLLAAAMQCTAAEKPCLACPQCRKVMAGVHPDVIVVDDTERKNVAVSLARWAKEDLYIRPKEGKKKVYLFPRAHDMGSATQNALLKVVEEPPAYGAFLLLTEKTERVLPTIRSRSAELNLAPVPQNEAAAFLQQNYPTKSMDAILSAWEQAGGFVGQAADILRAGKTVDARAKGICDALAAGDRLAMADILSKMEKLGRDQAISSLRQTQEIVAQALTAKAGRSVTEAARPLTEKLTAARLLQVYEVLGEALASAEANVGIGHICGFLAVRLR